MAYIKYIQDEDHYTKVIEKASSVKKSLWIGTADIKDLHVKAGNSSEPFLGVLAELLKRRVEVRMNHAKETGKGVVPTRAFQDDYLRFRRGLRRFCKPYRCRHLHEERQDQKL